MLGKVLRSLKLGLKLLSYYLSLVSSVATICDIQCFNTYLNNVSLSILFEREMRIVNRVVCWDIYHVLMPIFLNNTEYWCQISFA